MDDNWHLLVTRPNAEGVVGRLLTRYEFPHHVFRIRHSAVRRGVYREIVTPAFPGYIFVMARSCWNMISAFGGVIGFVKFGGVLTPVKEQAVKLLLGQADAEGFLTEAHSPSSARFISGDKVTIYGATLATGYNAIFQRLLDRDQALVLVEWMGRWVPLQVDERDLTLFVERKKKRPSKQHKQRRRSEAGARQVQSSSVVAAKAA